LSGTELAFAATSIDSDLILELRMTLGLLPRDCLKIFLLSRILGYSHAEVAREAGISIRSVHRSINRALDHIDPDFGFEAKDAAVRAATKKVVRPSPNPAAPIVLTSGPRNFAEPRPTGIRTNSMYQEAPMKIRIAKRVALNVIGRASARCASTCAVTNG
jgi:Mb-OB3b family methanobactin precursor